MIWVLGILGAVTAAVGAVAFAVRKGPVARAIGDSTEVTLVDPVTVTTYARVRTSVSTEDDIERLRLPAGTVLYQGRPILATELASLAGVDAEVYALARTIASEANNKTPSNAERVAIAWAVKNYAARAKVTIQHLVTRIGAKASDATKRAAGMFGAQYQFRFVATVNDPPESDVTIARGVISGALADPTGGAIQFDHPAAFASQTGVKKTADEVAQIRQSEGKVAVTLAEAPGLRLWRPA